MRFAVLALIFVVPALAAQDNEAEKLFRQLEKKLTDAKTYRAVGELDIPKGPGKIKVSLTVAGDKFRMDAQGMQDDKAFRVELISDGTKIKTIQMPKPDREEQPAPKNIGRTVSKLLARVGLAAIQFPTRTQKGEEAKEIDADELLRVSDFKMGEPAKVGGKDARVITFTVTPRKQEKDAATVTLWIDAKTLLPLRQVITPPKQDRQITTTYTTFEINPKVDPKSFELPK